MCYTITYLSKGAGKMIFAINSTIIIMGIIIGITIINGSVAWCCADRER
jgi:hypothetical protein